MPISLALFVPQLNFIINNIFLGHLSEASLATASISGVYYLIFAGIGYGLNSGLQSLISRRAGENKPAEIGTIFHQGIIIALSIAATGMLLTYFLAPLILKPFIHSETIYNDAIGFLNIRVLGLPFLYIYQMRNALLVGINRSGLLVIGTAAEAVTNIFFDYTLIFGYLGFPKMGFNGAAVASVISEFTGMFVIFLVINFKGIGKQFSLLKKFVPDKKIILKILNLSAPLIFQYALSVISWFFFYLLIEHHGQMNLAISNAMRNVFGFFGVFGWAFSSTANSMVSNVMGQRKQEKIIPLIIKITKLSTSLAVFFCLLLNLFPSVFLSIYGQDELFRQNAIAPLRVVAFSLIIMAAATVWLNAITGTGKSRVTFMIELFAIIFYCAYVYYILEISQKSITWGWMSELLYWSLLLSLSFFYIKSKRWQSTII